MPEGVGLRPCPACGNTGQVGSEAPVYYLPQLYTSTRQGTGGVLYAVVGCNACGSQVAWPGADENRQVAGARATQLWNAIPRADDLQRLAGLIRAAAANLGVTSAALDAIATTLEGGKLP